ncbi:MAG: hypothetical protein R3B07_12155 [Polyangiaceae bacterium]
MLFRRRVRRLALVLGLVIPAPALATPATTRVVWQASDQCMSADELRTGVERRLGRSVFQQDADLVLRGNATFRDGKAHAELELRTADTPAGKHGTLVGSRDLDMEGDDCRVLDDSLLLVTSIMIDVPEEELPPPPPPDEPEPEIEKPKAVPPLGTPLKLPKPPRPASAAQAPPWRYGLFVDATTSAGALPLGSFGGDLGLRVEPGGFWPLELSANFDHGSASASDGSLTLNSVTSGLLVCPFDFGLEVCAGQRVGAVWARGAQLESNRTRRRIRGELSLGLRWAPAIGSNQLVVGVEALVPMVQDRYFYERAGREIELFHVAPIGGRLSIGFRLGL